jgi:hypothetical protein
MVREIPQRAASVTLEPEVLVLLHYSLLEALFLADEVAWFYSQDFLNKLRGYKLYIPRSILYEYLLNVVGVEKSDLDDWGEMARRELGCSILPDRSDLSVTSWEDQEQQCEDYLIELCLDKGFKLATIDNPEPFEREGIDTFSPGKIRHYVRALNHQLNYVGSFSCSDQEPNNRIGWQYGVIGLVILLGVLTRNNNHENIDQGDSDGGTGTAVARRPQNPLPPPTRVEAAESDSQESTSEAGQHQENNDADNGEGDRRDGGGHRGSGDDDDGDDDGGGLVVVRRPQNPLLPLAEASNPEGSDSDTPENAEAEEPPSQPQDKPVEAGSASSNAIPITTLQSGLDPAIRNLAIQAAVWAIIIDSHFVLSGFSNLSSTTNLGQDDSRRRNNQSPLLPAQLVAASNDFEISLTDAMNIISNQIDGGVNLGNLYLGEFRENQLLAQNPNNLTAFLDFTQHLSDKRQQPIPIDLSDSKSGWQVANPGNTVAFTSQSTIGADNIIPLNLTDPLIRSISDLVVAQQPDQENLLRDSSDPLKPINRSPDGTPSISQLSTNPSDITLTLGNENSLVPNLYPTDSLIRSIPDLVGTQQPDQGTLSQDSNPLKPINQPLDGTPSISQPSTNPLDTTTSRPIKTSIDPNFDSGVYTVDSSGQVSIDYLFDGGWYQGEVGIFNLDEMDFLLMDANTFAQEAIRRVLSNSQLGHIVLSDQTEGAKFSGKLLYESQDYNSGSYTGIKQFSMAPGSKFGIILISDNTFQAALNQPNRESPIFSLVKADDNALFQNTQMVSLSNDSSVIAIEDITLNSAYADQDYNDVVIRVSGATSNLSPRNLTEVSQKIQSPEPDTPLANGKANTCNLGSDDPFGDRKGTFIRTSNLSKDPNNL